MEGSLLGSKVLTRIKDLFPTKLIFTIMSGEYGEEEGGGGSLVGYNQTLGIGGGVGEESDWILMVDGREGEGVKRKEFLGTIKKIKNIHTFDKFNFLALLSNMSIK